MVSLKKIYHARLKKAANLALSLALVSGLCATSWPLGLQTALAADNTTQLSAGGANGLRATTLGAGNASSSFVAVTAADVKAMAESSTKMPVKYLIERTGQICTGEELGLTDSITSGNVSTAANIRNKGVNVSSLNNIATITIDGMAVKHEGNSSETAINSVFVDESGRIYYSSTAYAGSTTNVNTITKDINDNKKMLGEGDYLVVKLKTHEYRTLRTYDGIVYAIDTSRTNGCQEAHTSGYRAATIGAGNERSFEEITGYGAATNTPVTVGEVSVAVPLAKTIEANDTLAQLKGVLAEGGRFAFDIKQTSGSDDAVIELADGSEGTQFILSVDELLARGDVNASASSMTYTFDGDKAPWKITFDKEGTYTFEVSEAITDAKSGISYDTSVSTLTYYVVEEEGSLRIAEAYKSANANDLEPTVVRSQNLAELGLGSLFDTTYALGTATRKPPTITRQGSTIRMELNQDTSGVITTQFGFDFSRSFEVEGHAKTPDSDAVAFAFHGYSSLPAYRWNSNNAFDDFHYGDGNYGDIMRYGYIPPNTDLQKGFLLNLITRNLGDVRGYYAFVVKDNVRIPYRASSGLNGDVKNSLAGVVPNEKSYETFGDAEEKGYRDAWSDFKLSFICRDGSVGLGTLKITLMGKTIEFNDFNASDILGEDVWQNAYFSIGSSVQDCHAGGLEFDEQKYVNEALQSATTSFWADRNHDGVYETQVNTTNSFAVPGESILVRHTLKSQNTSGNTYYENVLVRKLKDVEANASITGTDFASYPVGDTSKALQVVKASDAAFNTDDLTKAMRVAVFDNAAGTNFEYKITAPNAYNHTVVESALFGQPPFPTIQTEAYGFRTENKLEWDTPSFTNKATLCKVTYNYNDDFATDDKVEKALVGADYTVAAEAPKREGFTFAGWLATDAATAASIVSGSGSTSAGSQAEETIYQPGDTIPALEGDVTLVAKWIESGFAKLTHETRGDYADMTKEFSIAITAPAAADLKLYDNAQDAAAKKQSADKAGSAISKKENTDGTVTYTGVKLGNDESLYLEYKPGYDIAFIETDADAYTTTATLDGKNLTLASDHMVMTELPVKTLDEAANLTITDTLGGVPSTGILGASASWLAVTAGTALALLALFLYRRAARRTR